MGHQAVQKQPFRGAKADFFLNNLLDQITGLLSAPISPQTRAAANKD
jgi:hypothetical protein